MIAIISPSSVKMTRQSPTRRRCVVGLTPCKIITLLAKVAGSVAYALILALISFAVLAGIFVKVRIASRLNVIFFIRNSHLLSFRNHKK